jgi:hypothetical protein
MRVPIGASPIPLGYADLLFQSLCPPFRFISIDSRFVVYCPGLHFHPNSFVFPVSSSQPDGETGSERQSRFAQWRGVSGA